MLRSAALALVAAASLLLLPGCAWLLGPSVADGGAEESWGSSDLDVATANVRTAIPALEAWYAENSSYEGATVEVLRTWDTNIGDVEIARADVATYCISSTVGSATASKHGPAADIQPGGC